MTEEPMSMVFAFTDQSPSFVNGFEAGLIWGLIEAGEPLIDLGYMDGFPIHVENREVVSRMAASRNYHVEFRDVEVEGWIAARLAVQHKPRPALSLVGKEQP